MPLEEIGRLISRKREKLGLGIRAAAREIGVSHATLARVEKGFLPDLQNYEKIRRWLGVDQESPPATLPISSPQVHFRREKTASREAAAALARMIIAAQEAWPKKKR